MQFQKIRINYVATRLKEKDIKDLEKIFFEIDENKDGTLTYDEVKKSFMKLINEKNLKLNFKEIETLFKGIDINNSKRIEYTEFIAAMLEESPYCKEDRLNDIFKMLDKDGSGKISKNEIKEILESENVRDEDLNNFMNTFDLNGDGQIDYKEYITCMTGKDKREKETRTI